MALDLNVVELSRDVTVATHRNAVLVHFRGETPVGCVSSVETAMATVARGNPKVVFFSLIELQSIPPDQEARRAFAKFFEKHSGRLAAVIVTYRGEGFRAAMIRTIVSGIVNLLPRVRFPFPRHVVGSLDEAATLALRESPGLDTAALLAAFAALAAMPAPAGR